MSADAKSLPVHEMDTNILFEKFTVEEIRNIEKRTRADIERKKEDLRTMVGERYRDLIEAADTISDMKVSSQKVMSTIERMETLCAELKQEQMIKGSSLHQRKKIEMDNKRKEEARFYGVASQIQLLLIIPEKIWTCLDCANYLTASRLYLLAQHINTSLHLDSHNSPNFLYWFPVLNRQWAAISHFKHTILMDCRNLLKDPNVNDQKIAESLCSILLLENSNPRQVFNEFLMARTAAVQQLFHANNETTSTRDQICTVVQILTQTLHQAHAVFCQGMSDSSGDSVLAVPSNLLETILTRVTTEKQSESGLIDLHTSGSARCLPRSVTEFTPSQKFVSQGVSQNQLQDNCTQWMQTCTSAVLSGVTKLLNFVNSLKHLGTIRDSVWEMMAQDQRIASWGTVCQTTLNKHLDIWADMLQPLFQARVKALILYQLEAAVTLTQRQVTKVLSDLETSSDEAVSYEVELPLYLWAESPRDIAPNTAWGSQGSRSLADGNGLLMKAKAFTPLVQSLCKHFDEKLRTLKNDYSHYLFTDPESNTVTMETMPFNRFVDTPMLLMYIQTSCVERIQSLLGYLKVVLATCKGILSQATDRCDIVGNKLLLTGRLCAALCHLTPNLQQCMLGAEQVSMQEEPRSVSKRFVRGGPKQEVNAVWQGVKEDLIQHQNTVYRVWLDHLTAISIRAFTLVVNTDSPKHVVKTCSRWDEVSIEEENEAGKKVTSKIYVPMQASWYLLTLLYNLCKDLNRIGDHALSRTVLEHLVQGLTDSLAQTYSQVLSSQTSLSQNRALQLLFDVRFLMQILPRKEESQEMRVYQKKMETVISQLEEKIDPFDLDVFSPFMQSNLNKSVQRSAVMLGALTSLDKNALYSLTSRPVSSTGQEQHNVLQLSTCQSRFSTLPLSLQTSRNVVPQPVIPQTLYRGAEGGPTLTETAAAVLPNQPLHRLTTSSFYDKLGSMSEISSWFSTIGSK